MNMQIIYEVPGTFKITQASEFAAGPGSRPLLERTNPFCLYLQLPGTVEIESVQLTAELFGLLLRLTPSDAKVLRKHLHPQFEMSEAMMEQISLTPRELSNYLHSN